jgi:four helix bundle protein
MPGTAHRFEELDAWQLCMELADLVERITESFSGSTDDEYCKQLRRSAAAPAPLIAEGFVRFTPSEIVRYLRMARAELAEVQSHLERAKRQRYFAPAVQQEAETMTRRAMACTTALLKSKLPLLASQPRSNRRRP